MMSRLKESEATAGPGCSVSVVQGEEAPCIAATRKMHSATRSKWPGQASQCARTLHFLTLTPTPPAARLGKRFPTSVLVCSLVVLVGVAIVTVSDVAVHPPGVAMAMLFTVTGRLGPTHAAQGGARGCHAGGAGHRAWA